MDQVGVVLMALGDPTRRAILQRLRAQPRAVAEIASDFDVSRPAVSQHIKVLHDAGLLRLHRSGRQNYYALDLRGIGILRGYVESFWDDVLGAFQAAAIEASKSDAKPDTRADAKLAHKSDARPDGKLDARKSDARGEGKGDARKPDTRADAGRSSDAAPRRKGRR